MARAPVCTLSDARAQLRVGLWSGVVRLENVELRLEVCTRGGTLPRPALARALDLARRATGDDAACALMRVARALVGLVAA